MMSVIVGLVFWAEVVYEGWFGGMTAMVVVVRCMVNLFGCCGGRWLVVLLGHLLFGL
jgi:hypothetical protein